MVLRFDRGVIAGIVLLAAMMIGIAVITIFNTRMLRDLAGRATHSREVLEAVGNIRAETRKLQAGQRAFIISGIEDRLVPYREAANAIRMHAGTLKSITAADADHWERVEKIHVEIAEGLARLDEIIILRREKGMPAILELTSHRGQRSYVDPLLEVLEEIDRAESAKLAEREEASQKAYDRAMLFGMAAAVVGLAVLGLFTWMLARSAASQAWAMSRLAEQRELLNATLTSIGDGVIATDAAGKITFLNDVAVKLTGWSQPDAAGVQLEKVFHIVNESTRMPVDNPAIRALEQGVVVGLANHTVLIARNGTERPIDDSAAPILTRGEVSGAVLVFRDITEKHEAALRLRSSEEQHRTMLESITDSFFAVDRAWRFTYVNRQAESMLGRLRGELIGQVVWNLFPGLQGSEFERAFHRAMDEKAGSMVSGFYPDHERWYECRTFPAANGITIYVRDITEQKWAEADVARMTSESERQRRIYETALANNADFNYIFDLEGRFTYVNPPLLSLWQKTLSEAVGRNFHDLDYTPELATRLQRQIQEVIDTRQPLRDETPYSGPGGGGVYEYIFVPVIGAGGKVEAVAGSTRDVTARKTAEAERERLLREVETERRRLADVFQHAPAFMCVLRGPEHVFERANDGYKRLVGGRELIGRTVGEVLPEVAGQGFLELLDHVYRTGEAYVGSEVRVELDPGGGGRPEARFLDFVYQPLRDADGVVTGILVQGVDLTDRKQAERERETLLERLREQDKRKDEFLATLAHELRNPLAPVRNGVQILRNALPADPPLLRTVEMMERQVGQLVHLVDDLMDVSRVSRGKVILRRERVELREVVDSAVETTRHAIESAGHELQVRLPSARLAFDADKTRLVQVLANLLGNAAKYTPPNGRIEIAADREGAEAAIRVVDTGVGIPAEMLPNVFDMFTQVGTSLDRAQGGLGIGLTLVRRLVELHGGRVAAKSAGLGKGSEFTIRLPLAGDPPEPSSPVTVAGPASSVGLKILIVDDNHDAADSLAMLMQLFGHEAEVVYDGISALHKLDTYIPKVIFLDIGLPGMNGYEVAKSVRSRADAPGIVIIALTGWGQEEDRRRTREAGFDHHLVKPVDLPAIEKLLKQIATV